MIDLDKLEAVAKAGMPGPWLKSGTVVGSIPADMYTHMAGVEDEDGYFPTILCAAAEDAAYVAAANPATVLALIAELRDARRDLAAMMEDNAAQAKLATEACERAAGLVETIAKLSEANGELRAQIEQYQALCAAAYQLAGAMNAPVRFLDALSDGANGELKVRAKTDDLLPVTSGEVGTFADALTLTMDELALIRTAAHVGSSLGNEHMAWGLRAIYTKLGGK